jgi:hypothetical protein
LLATTLKLAVPELARLSGKELAPCGMAKERTAVEPSALPMTMDCGGKGGCTAPMLKLSVQGEPLKTQLEALEALTVPVPLKPSITLPPTGMEPFQLSLVTV